MAAVAGIHQAAMPQPRVELADPTTLQITGEFTEGNLGSALEPDGSVTVRAVGQQYSFTPQCPLVPAGTPVTLRATSADVVHGFLIDGTNLNAMLIPGYVSTMRLRFEEPGERLMPCHEFRGACCRCCSNRCASVTSGTPFAAPPGSPGVRRRTPRS